MSYEEPVVVTGLAVICALGDDRESVWWAVREGKCALEKLETVDTSELYFDYGGEARSFRPEALLNARQRHRMDRSSQMAVCTAETALRHAELDLGRYDPYRVGVSLGTSLGGLKRGESFHQELLERGLARTRPSLLRDYPLYTPADNISIHFGTKGPKVVISNACAAGGNAIGVAADLIQSGRVDVMIAGGVDPLDILSLAGFNSLRAVDPERCSPYGRSRGINISEGAAILILESASLAARRRAPMLAYMLGYGLSSDAYHATSPDPAGSGAVRSMRRALSRSGLTPEDIGYVNGHGTGTPANDAAETKAIKTFFGSRAAQVPVSSTKSQVGHSLGAAGAVEAAVCVMALRDQILPPTVNIDSELADASLDFVPAMGRRARFDTLISNSFAFGGNNCSLVLGRSPNHTAPVEPRPVFVTGAGVVSPLGTDRQRFIDALRAGESAVTPVRSFDVESCRGQVAAEITDDSYMRFVDPRLLRKLDQLGRMSVAAARMACADASLHIHPSESDRIGVVFATGTGPMETVEAVSDTIIREGAHKVNPRLFPNTVMNAAAGHVCLSLQIKGPTSTIATGCTAGLSAVLYATEMIRRGEADAMLVVSSDELTQTLHFGYDRLGVLTPAAVKPYDKERDGIALAAGGVALVLESAEHALARGARLEAEIAGAALTSDAYGVAANDPSGEAWAQCFVLGLREAGINVDELGCIYGDARGASVLDHAEAKAIASVFAKHPTRLANLTGQLGHAQGSAALFSLVAALETCRNGWLPAVVGLDDPLPEVELFCASSERTVGNSALVSSANWGGTYASVVVRGPAER